MTTHKTVSDIVDALIDGSNPGITVTATHTPLPRTGYLVGGVVPVLAISRGQRIALAQPHWQIDRWVTDYLPFVVHTPATYFGAWVDSEGTVHYDVSQNIPELDRAIELGKDRGQFSLWDNANGTEIVL